MRIEPLEMGLVSYKKGPESQLALLPLCEDTARWPSVNQEDGPHQDHAGSRTPSL